MSIILDALSKVSDGEALPPELKTELPKKPEPPQRSSPKKTKKILLGSSLVLVVLASLLFVLNSRPALPPSSTAPVQEIKKPAASQILQPVSSKQSWMLNGIIHGEEKVALINNQLVRTGDTIAQARLEEIREKEVVLSHRGKQILLSLR